MGNDKNNLTVDWSHYHANITMGKECWSWASRCLWGVKKYNSPKNACVYVLSAWFRLFYKFILTLELTRISRNYQSSSEICLDLQRWFRFLQCSASEGRIIILWLTDWLPDTVVWLLVKQLCQHLRIHFSFLLSDCL